MIVNTMDLDNRKMNYFRIKRNGRLFSLLFFIFIIFLSCEKKKTDEKLYTKNQKQVSKSKDTIAISVAFNEKIKTGLNVVDTFLNYDYLEFESNQKKDTIVAKNISNQYEYQILKFVGFSVIHGEMTRFRHYYLVQKDHEGLQFRFDKGNIVLESEESAYLSVVDDLFQTYQFRLSNKLNLVELDSIYASFQKKYSTSNQLALKKLNDYHYYNRLQELEPNNKRVNEYLKNISTPFIVGDPLNNLIFFYVKNNIDMFDFSKLTDQNYSQNYLDLLSIGVFNFLKHQDNKGDQKYNSAIDWLKTTDLYKKESDQIEKQITPLDKRLFKEKLKNIQLLNTENESLVFTDIIKQNPSKYYLIDFWATWCKPCIKGVHIMKEMELPKNLSVISLSLDRKKDAEKWKNMTKKLGQDISFFVEEDHSKNQEFLKFIELQSVPRYILIDKNLNLIDESFLHPQEPLFLSKLNDLDNAKYW